MSRTMHGLTSAAPTLQGSRRVQQVQQEIKYTQDIVCMPAEVPSRSLLAASAAFQLSATSTLDTERQGQNQGPVAYCYGRSQIPSTCLRSPNIAQLAHSLIDVLLAGVHVTPQLVYSPLCGFRLLFVDGQLLLSTLHLDVDILHLQAMRESISD